MLQRALLCPHCGCQSPTAEHAAHHLTVTCPLRLVHCPSSSLHHKCKYSSSSSLLLRKSDLQKHMDLECEDKEFSCQECGRSDFENFSTWNDHVYPFCASSVPPACPLCQELLDAPSSNKSDGDDDDSRIQFANHVQICAAKYLMEASRKASSISPKNHTNNNRISVETTIPSSTASSSKTKSQQRVYKDPRSLFFFDDDDYYHHSGSHDPSTRHNSPSLVNHHHHERKNNTSPRMINQAMLNGGISFASPAAVVVAVVAPESIQNQHQTVSETNDETPQSSSSPVIFGSWVTEDQKRQIEKDSDTNSKMMNGKSKFSNMADTPCVNQIRKNENRLMQDHYVSPPQHIFVKQTNQIEGETIYQRGQESEVVSSASRKRFLKTNEKVGSSEEQNIDDCDASEQQQQQEIFSPSPRISDAVIVSKILFGTTSSSSEPVAPQEQQQQIMNQSFKVQEKRATYSSLYVTKRKQQQHEEPINFSTSSAIVPVFTSRNNNNNNSNTIKKPTAMTTGASSSSTPNSSATMKTGLSSRHQHQQQQQTTINRTTPPPSMKFVGTTSSRTPRVSSPVVVAESRQQNTTRTSSSNMMMTTTTMRRTPSNNSTMTTTSNNTNNNNMRRTSSNVSHVSSISGNSVATKRQPFSAIMNMSLIQPKQARNF